MKVVALSIITNLAAGMSKTELSHQETLDNAALAAAALRKLLVEFIATLR